MLKLERTTQWMETHMGKQLYIPVTPDMLHEQDIAHALSMQCRYGGHVLRFYSVSEHSCYVSDHILEQTGDKVHALAGLMHDGSEAYLVDIPKPIKPYLTNYKELEAQIEVEICKKWGLVYPWSDLIKITDCRILLDERQQLFDFSGFDWELPVSEPLGIKINAWAPEEAKAQFLERFHALTQ